MTFRSTLNLAYHVDWAYVEDSAKTPSINTWYYSPWSEGYAALTRDALPDQPQKDILDACIAAHPALVAKLNDAAALRCASRNSPVIPVTPGAKQFFRIAAVETDSDADGLADWIEWERGLSPFLADTDGDGVGDLEELLKGSDPRNASSIPAPGAVANNEPRWELKEKFMELGNFTTGGFPLKMGLVEAGLSTVESYPNLPSAAILNSEFNPFAYAPGVLSWLPAADTITAFAQYYHTPAETTSGGQGSVSPASTTSTSSATTPNAYFIPPPPEGHTIKAAHRKVRFARIIPEGPELTGVAIATTKVTSPQETSFTTESERVHSFHIPEGAYASDFVELNPQLVEQKWTVVTLTPLPVDLDVNTDRSFESDTGAETITQGDETGEDAWKPTRGAALHVNYDRDGELPDNEFDAITYDPQQNQIKENWTIGSEKDQMDLAFIEVTGTEDLGTSSRIYLRSRPKPQNEGSPAGSSHTAEVEAFHLYTVNRAGTSPTFTPVWGGRLPDLAPQSVEFGEEIDITKWVVKSATGYTETRPGATGPYRFAIEGLIYPGMKLGNDEPFDGDIRIAVSLGQEGTERTDLDVVVLGMPKQEYDTEGRAKCPQKEDGSYPSTAANAVGVANEKFLPSFPGAEGFGRWSAGGRFGAVLEVTKTADDGSAGTLRWAMTQNIPRTVIVRLAGGTDGNIDLTKPILVKQSNLSFAGQTASGKGLCVRKFKVGTGGLTDDLPSSHFVFQHLRSRAGRPESTRGTDSLEILRADHVMVDHCSASWANDEQLSVVESGRVTVQWCFIAEGLALGNHNENPDDADPNKHHGMGTLARGSQAQKSHYTFHHNYWACVKERMPRPGYSLKGGGGSGPVIDVRNNVMFNWEGKYPSTNEDPDKPSTYNFVNNRYSPGLDSDRSQNDTKWYFMREKAPLASAYWAGNKFWDSSVEPQSTRIKLESVGPPAASYFQTTPFESEFVTTEDSNSAMGVRIFDHGGASFTRDSADNRVATDGNARVLTHTQEEVGGWPALENQAPPIDTDGDGVPDSHETGQGMNPKDAKDVNLDPDGNGYSHLEEYIHSLSSIP